MAQYLPVIHKRLERINTPSDFIDAFVQTTVHVFWELPDLKRRVDWQRLEPESLTISGWPMISTGEIATLLEYFQQLGAVRSDLSASEIIQLLINFSNTAAAISPGQFRDDIFAEMFAGTKRVLLC